MKYYRDNGFTYFSTRQSDIYDSLHRNVVISHSGDIFAASVLFYGSTFQYQPTVQYITALVLKMFHPIPANNCITFVS